MKFVIEQIALAPLNSEEAINLLRDLGMTEWVVDAVAARGEVRGESAENRAVLKFNYQALTAAKELEVLQYNSGDHWMQGNIPSASHFGMHVAEGDLPAWRQFFDARGIRVVQEIHTIAHSNPEITGKRWYHYVIFGTRDIIGVDLKFIARLDVGPASAAGS